MGYLRDLFPELKKFLGFFLQSILVAVSFIDPGNFSSNTTSGALYQYKLLFIIFVSNLFAILMQCLCIKLGSITGLDLAENCRRHLPRGLNIILYIFAESAIIATDLAEVVGTAIALDILFGIPLNYGVLVTVLDVIFILFFYNPDNSIKQVRFFEVFVSLLVGGTILCFIVELFSIDIPHKKTLFEGFLPSKSLLEDQAIYLGCAIVGATIMPHSLYLGSALVQPRLKDYDEKHGLLEEPKRGSRTRDRETAAEQAPLLQSSEASASGAHHGLTDLMGNSTASSKDEVVPYHGFSSNHDLKSKYKPSAEAIGFSLKYSYWELIISLLFVATFVNSAILIIAGTVFYGTPDAEDADLVSIYELLTIYVSKGVGLIYAFAMLFSGQASGLVVTLAGQVVSEGFIHWKFKPWIRRLLTRMIAIIPCLLVTYTAGRKGINDILNGSQVVLSFILPFCSAPLVYFTCNKKIMKVAASKQGPSSTTSESYGATSQGESAPGGEGQPEGSDAAADRINKVEYIDYSNSTALAAVSIIAWATIAILNIMNIVFMSKGLV